MGTNRLKHLGRVLAFSGLTIGVTTGCGDSSAGSSGPTGPAPGQSVNENLTAIGPWEVFSPPDPPMDGPAGAMQSLKDVVGGETYACTTTPFSITATPDKIAMYSPNASVMWLGNLIQGRSYDALGSLRELSIRQRAPLGLSIDLLTGDNFEIVQNPSLTSVDAAIGGLVQRAHDRGHRAGSSISYEQELTHSVRQAALKLGLSGSYLGNSAEARLESVRNSSQRTLTAHFIQKMFTVAVELPQNPADFFSADFTPAVLEQERGKGNIGRDNPPVYIANIVYGRMLTYSLTSSDSEARMRAAIDYSFNGVVASGSVYSEADLQTTLSQQNIKVQTIGGDGDAALALISTGNLAAYFDKNAPLTTARPLSYQLNNLADNRIAKVSETTSYILNQCSPIPDIESNFDAATIDGWKAFSGTITPQTVFLHGAVFQGGSHSIYTNGNDNWFLAPQKYLGDKSAYYGGTLSYWYLWSNPSTNAGVENFDPDVVITGRNGVVVSYTDPGASPGVVRTWQRYETLIDDSSGWVLGQQTRGQGQPATRADIEGVLADVLRFEIRGSKRNTETNTNHYIDELQLKG